MTHTTHRIGTLVTRIQHEFLDTPGLTLTHEEAETRFGLDAATCAALLDFLAEAGVLARTHRRGCHAFLLRGAGPQSSGPGPSRRASMRSPGPLDADRRAA